MKPDRTKVILALIFVFAIFSVVSLLYWSFIRDAIVMPIYYVLWVGDLTLKSVPQEVLLAFLILLCILIGFNTLGKVRAKRLIDNNERARAVAGTRYLFWKRIYSHLDSSQLSRNHFASETRRLILSILAYQEGVDTFEIERMISDGILSVPDSVRKLILKQEMQAPIRPQKAVEGVILRLRYLIFGAAPEIDPQIDPQTDEIVSFIEQRLEIKRDGN